MGNQTVLVIVAHPDDEVIGLGGTIAKYSRSGLEIIAVSMTNGVGARPANSNSEVMLRKEAAQHASSILGFAWAEMFDFPDNAMDSVPLIKIVKGIEEVKLRYQPALVFTHSPSDLNIDHRLTAEAALTAFRPQPGETCRELRAFEVASATDFSHPSIREPFAPNLFIDIDSYWGIKVDALHAYDRELREFPHSRSIEGMDVLSRYRGCQVGIKRAEAFQILRKIDA